MKIAVSNPITKILTIFFMAAILCHSLAADNMDTRPATEKQNTWWANAVGYQMFVRSFQDSNGDGIGDFRGATTRLDYLKDLGINLIWLMPVFPSPSYHGYDVTDEKNINPDYGTLEDFDAFLSAAKTRNMHVILDFVPNHVSSSHPWFIESKNPNSAKRDWFLWRDAAPAWNKPWGEMGTVWHSSNNTLVVFPGTIQKALGGKEWNPSGPEAQATETTPGVFEFVAELPAGRYEYKVAIGGSWGENYGASDKRDGPNVVLNLNTTKIVRFVYDSNKHSLRDSVNNPEIKAPTTVPPANTAITNKNSFYYGAFWAGMPDLNWRNPDLEAAMNDAAKFWLDRGVDGFRLDAIRYVVEANTDDATGNAADGPDNILWAKKFTDFVKSVKPEAMLVGEAWTDANNIAKYTKATNGELMAFNFELQSRILESVQAGKPDAIKTQLAKPFAQNAVDALFFSNHDMNRPVFFNAGRYRVAADVLLTLPGQPWLYYGQELGMGNSVVSGDEGKRAPMRWDETANAGFTNGKAWSAFAGTAQNSVAAQQKDQTSLLHHYQNLIALRQANVALRVGGYVPLETGERVLGFIRNTAEQSVLVLINLDSDPANVKLNLASTQYKNSVSSQELSSGKYMQLNNIKLAPYGLLLLKLPKN